MAALTKQEHERLSMELITFAKDEIERRKKAPVFVSGESVEAQHKEHYHILIVDPRIGFNQKTFRFWINRISPGDEEGAARWKTLGHRHTVEAVIYILKGRGHSIIDGIRHDWEPGDFICVPFFAWHRHVNSGDETMVYLAATTGPLSMYLGVAIYEDERFPEHWVFAQGGEEAMKRLIPGVGEADPRKSLAPKPVGDRIDLSSMGDVERIYAEQLLFAEEEEKRRRVGKVLVKGASLKFERTPMGLVAPVVDPKLGFHVRTLSTQVALIPPGKRSGAHRHIYEETNYILSGQGESVIEDQVYRWKTGDTLCIPVFAWHQYFNTGDEPVRIMVHSSRVAMENLGYLVVQQGEEANF
jgi:gentisate 1,2-dioxygenase